jgi:hypothetical protein
MAWLSAQALAWPPVRSSRCQTCQNRQGTNIGPQRGPRLACRTSTCAFCPAWGRLRSWRGRGTCCWLRPRRWPSSAKTKQTSARIRADMIPFAFEKRAIEKAKKSRRMCRTEVSLGDGQPVHASHALQTPSTALPFRVTVALRRLLPVAQSSTWVITTRLTPSTM